MSSIEIRTAAKDKVVVVTGGSSGLGAAVVQEVEASGARAVIVDRQPPKRLNGKEPAHHVELVDLARTRDAEAAVRRVGDKLGRIDAVVTCAAMDRPGDFADVDGERWDRTVMVNLLGTAAVIRAALPWLEKARGQIVTVASTLGLRALPAATAYCASKFGIVGFTRALALELQGKVGVTMLVPGGMRTSFFDGRDPRFQPGPNQLLNDPADVARCVLFALSQPPGCEVREMLVTPSTEPSWP